jgi:hypothetical protein
MGALGRMGDTIREVQLRSGAGVPNADSRPGRPLRMAARMDSGAGPLLKAKPEIPRLLANLRST